MEFIKLWGETVVYILLFLLGCFSAGVMLVGFVLMFTEPLFGLAFVGGLLVFSGIVAYLR